MGSRSAFVVGSVSAVSRMAHPPGAALARKLRAEIDAGEWTAGELEPWWDAGWRFGFRRGEGRLELVVAPAGDAWAVQIAPARLPGRIARALGRGASATAADCFEVALAAHAVIAGDARFGEIRWQWGGFPTEKRSTPEPTPPVVAARGRGGRRS